VGIQTDPVPKVALASQAVKHKYRLRERQEVHPDYLRIEVADAGGPWRGGPRDDGRPHGLDIVEAIAGPHHWGMDEDTDGRIAWAELDK
jgi:hypothetical protein